MHELRRPDPYMAPHGKGGGGHRRGAPRIQPPAATEPTGLFSRRQAFVIGGASAVGLLAILVGSQAPGSDTPKATPATPIPSQSGREPRAKEANLVELNSSEFSGEIEETRALFLKWEQEHQKGADLGTYKQKLIDLAVAFYSKQRGFDKNIFKDRVLYVADKVFEEKLSRSCVKPKNVEYTFGIGDDPDGNIYLADKLIPAFQKNRKGLMSVFMTVLHELHHRTVQKRPSTAAMLIDGVVTRADYEQGGSFIFQQPDKDAPDKLCAIRSYSFLDEAIVEDANRRLFTLLQIDMTGAILPHEEYVAKYRKNVLEPYYGGDHQELYEYQSQSRALDILLSIGKKRGAQTREEQHMNGGEFLVGLFEGK